MRKLLATVAWGAATVLISTAVLQSVPASQRGATAASLRQTGFVFDELYRRNLVGDAGHPDRPERLTAVLGGLEKAGLLNALTRIPARPATDDELALAHDRSYVELVKRELANVEGVKQLSTGDTDVTRESLAAARAAAGGVLNAADAVASGRMKNAFWPVRPPGGSSGTSSSSARGSTACATICSASSTSRRKATPQSPASSSDSPTNSARGASSRCSKAGTDWTDSPRASRRM